MKKSTWIYAAIILALALVAVWLMQESPQKSTLEELKEDYSFYVEDTASIDRIVLYDKKPNRVELTRTDEGWMVDGKHPAREDAVLVLLATLYRMQLRNFIPEKMQKTVLTRMSVYGTTVELYANGEPLKTIIVGTDTDDEMGTYMMMKGASAPYAVHIPGFNGFLSSRFFTESYLWYKRIITRLDPNNIASVTVTYPDSLASSFQLERGASGDFTLTRASDKVEMPINELKAKLFLQAAANMRYEGAIIPSDPIYARADSLLASTPVFEINLSTREGEKYNLKGYRIKGPEAAYDPDAEAPEFDTDRLHALINEDQMVLVQYYALQRVLLPISELSQP